MPLSLSEGLLDGGLTGLVMVEWLAAHGGSFSFFVSGSHRLVVRACGLPPDVRTVAAGDDHAVEWAESPC